MAPSSKKAMSAPADRLMEVRPSRTLFWPDGNFRGHAGYTVREDDPFIAQYMHTLRPVSDPKREASEVTDPVWVARAVAEGYEKFGKVTRPTKKPDPIEDQPKPEDLPEADA